MRLFVFWSKCCFITESVILSLSWIRRLRILQKRRSRSLKVKSAPGIFRWKCLGVSLTTLLTRLESRWESLESLKASRVKRASGENKKGNADISKTETPKDVKKCAPNAGHFFSLLCRKTIITVYSYAQMKTKIEKKQKNEKKESLNQENEK